MEAKDWLAEKRRQDVDAARQRATSRQEPQPGDRDLVQQFAEWKQAMAARAKLPEYRNKYDRYR